MKSRDDKPKNPPNVYERDGGWTLDFFFRGERYTERLGPVSRTVARERAGNRRTAVAEGKLLVNGKRWTGTEWIAETEAARVKDLLFEEALERYLEFYQANRAASSYQKYALQSSKPLKKSFSGKTLSEISVFNIEAYKLDRLRKPDDEHPDRKPVSEVTVNRELTVLKHLYNLCIKWKFAKVNPMREVEMFKEDNGRTRYLDQEQAENLLSACGQDLRVVVLAAMHTGFRQSELHSLRFFNIDMLNRSVSVSSCYSKNGDPRTVPLTETLAEAFRKMIESRNPRPEDFVFTRNGKQWKDWRGAFNGAVARAGITDFTFHDLRHTYGSHLGMNSTNPKAMMQLMGHKTPSMNMRYTHLSVEYNRAAVQKLPQFGAGIMDSQSQRISQRPEKKKVVAFGK
jgi:integrase